MLSETAAEETLALILDGESFTNDELYARIRSAFPADGRSLEADVYTYAGKTLILAYPTPPLRERVGEHALRLNRR
ncbi:MAG: hypothetical protein ACI4PB_03150 [Oscillospiraceae bacterium]